MKFRRVVTNFLIAALLLCPAGARCAERIFTDQIGRSVVVPNDPGRVVSLAPSITGIIFGLGEEQRLKGVTTFSDFPEAARTLPKIGSYVHPDLEKIVALEPDLCIAVKDGNPMEIAQRLEALKIPVYAVDPRNLQSVMETVMEIGRLLNAEKQAEILVNGMRSRIQGVTSLVAKAGTRPRVFYQIGISPIVSAGTNTFIHELIELAGGINVTAGPVAYPRLCREQVLALAPDVFVITSMAREAVFERVKKEWSKWPNLPAVRNNRIFLVNSDLFDRPTPRLVDGLEMLARLIHPELFEE